ncbi:hypothetical protein [Albidovulum sp.]
MPLPLAPVAGLALRYGALALVAYGLRRALVAGRTDQRAEDALDDLDEGIALHRPRSGGQRNAAARLRRVIRIGDAAWELDLAGLGRFRLRRTDGQ